MKTEDFKGAFDNVINALRFDENYGGVLKDRSALAAYCRRTPESSFGGDGREYGFRVDTEQYSYMLRLNPNRANTICTVIAMCANGWTGTCTTLKKVSGSLPRIIKKSSESMMGIKSALHCLRMKRWIGYAVTLMTTM